MQCDAPDANFGRVPRQRWRGFLLEDRPHRARLAFPMQEGEGRLQRALFFVLLFLQALCQPFAHGLLSRRGRPTEGSITASAGSLSYLVSCIARSLVPKKDADPGGPASKIRQGRFPRGTVGSMASVCCLDLAEQLWSFQSIARSISTVHRAGSMPTQPTHMPQLRIAGSGRA